MNPLFTGIDPMPLFNQEGDFWPIPNKLLRKYHKGLRMLEFLTLMIAESNSLNLPFKDYYEMVKRGRQISHIKWVDFHEMFASVSQMIEHPVKEKDREFGFDYCNT